MSMIKTKLATLTSAVILAAVAGQASAATYDISGSFGVTATIFGSPLTVPMTVTAGSYDSTAGAGSWSLSANLTGMGFGTITFDQTFTLNATTGLGNLAVATNCVGNGIACGGVGPNFNGPINAGGPIVAGLQNWVVTTPSFGSPTFAPTLTDTTPPPSVPVPAAAWLFGSGLLGLAGTARRRVKG